MELPRSLRIVSYAVNGRGLGHLARQVAIHRWLRRYATFAGVRSEHWFLTTSEADTLLLHEGFAGFKLPSKSVVEPAGIDKTSYLALAKQWVWHSLGLLRPDLFVVDTFPEGSFDELPAALDLCKHAALVLRPVKHDFMASPSFRAALSLYQRVIVPADDDEEDACAQIEAAVGGRARRTGPLSLVERFAAASPDEARGALGVPAGARCLLVTGGGGGDDDVGALMALTERALGPRDDVHVVYAAGPLYQGEARRSARSTWWTSAGLSRFLTGVDMAVSAAGFNAVHELLHAGVPALLVPQRKIADDQHARAARLAARGLALTAPLDDEPRFAAALGALLDDGRTREELRARVAAAGMRNHAREAAAALLELVLPRSVVRHAAAELDDDALARAARAGAELGDLVDLAGALAPAGEADRASLDVDPAIELLERAREAGMSAREVTRVVRALAPRRRARAADAAGVLDAVTALLEHPACLGQLSSLPRLVEALPPLKDASLVDACAAAGAVLDAALAAGRSLADVASRAAARRGEVSHRDILVELEGPLVREGQA